MDGELFIQVAEELANAKTEAHWRSAISRAYYAVFHVAKVALEKRNVPIPGTGDAHRIIKEWLIGQPSPEVTGAGSSFGALQASRRRADYDVNTRAVTQNDAMLDLVRARVTIKAIRTHL